MTENDAIKNPSAATLRQRAEAQSRADEPQTLAALSPEAARQALHELRVHQIELEMQNEELRQTQAELEESRARYFDLYNLAPVGHVTLSETGLILEANLTAAGLLGVARRGTLVRQTLTPFILPADQNIYYRHRKQLFETGAPRACELRLTRQDGSPFWARLEMTAAQDTDGAPVCRAVISDITAQKRAEEVLREAHQRLEATLSALPDAMLEVDAEGRIYDCRTPHPDLLPKPAGALVGQTVGEAWPEAAARVITEALARAALRGWSRGGTYMLEMPGQVRWFELSVTAKGEAPTPAERRFIVLARNVTDRKMAETALRASEERYQLVVDNLGEGVGFVDAQEQFAFANPASERIFGVPTGGLVGRSLLAFLAPEQAALVQTQAQLRRRGDTNVYELEIFRPDGERRILLVSATARHDAAGHYLGAFGVFRDITERKQMEERLRESEAKYRTIFENAPLGLFRSTPEGRFVEVNPALAQMLGYAAPEAVLREVHSIAEQIYVRSEARQSVVEAQLQGRNITRHVNHYRRADGTEFTANLFLNTERDQAGKPVFLEGMVEDITERVRAEQARQQAETEVRRLNAELEQRVADRTAELAARTAQLEAANRELRESQQKLETLFELLPVGVSVLDAEHRLAFMNPALEKILGLSAEGLRRGEHQRRAYLRPNGTPLPAEEFASARALREQRAVHNVETGVVLEDGRVIWTNVSAEPVAFRDWTVVIVTDDITERKQAEESLHESEARFQSTLDSMLEGCQIIGFDWRYLYLNPAADRHNRRPKTELLGKKYMEMWPGIETTTVFAAIRHCLEERTPHFMENEFIFPDGTAGWFELSIQPVPEGIFILSTDITARKQAELALRESEGRFRSVLENALDAAYRRNLQIDQYDYMSPVIEHLTGWTVEEMTHADIATILGRMYPDDLAGVEQEIERTMSECRATGRAAGEVEYRFLCKDGQYRWIADRLYVQADAAGQPLYRGGIFRDITARKQAEIEIRQLNQNLQHHIAQLDQANAALTQALRVKNEFLSVMSHELRTPLTAVLGLAEMLETGVPGSLTDKQRKYIQTIRASGQHLLDLISDVLDFVSVDAGRHQLAIGPIAVEELCQDSLKSIRAAVQQKKLQLTVNRDSSVEMMRGDGPRLKKLLVKLLDNAAKFTPAGGAIGLDVTGDAARQEVRFSVWDTGIGIAPADQARLFEPFVQLDSRLARLYEGAGMGLALVRRLAELHGGRVAVESEGVPGKGSRFTVCLPWTGA